MGHAEALFLVHHQKAQVLEADVLLQQLVGADEEVDLPGLEVVEDLPGLPGGLEAAQEEFEESFDYAETNDQLRCIADIKKDMEKPVPMDRLLCGDVGYGKTEVALRAVMKCVLDGKQALLPGGVRGEGKAGAALPLGVQGDEALGQVLGGGLGPAGPCPPRGRSVSPWGPSPPVRSTPS